MSRFKDFQMKALVLSSVLALPCVAQAQQYYNQGNYGNVSQTNWQSQGGIHTQRPGAAIVGGLLSGIGAGLHAENPQKHAVASNVLNGLGGGMMIASQPTVWQQGSVQHINQGWNNQQGGVQPISNGGGWGGGVGNGGWGGGLQPQPINRPWCATGSCW